MNIRQNETISGISLTMLLLLFLLSCPFITIGQIRDNCSQTVVKAEDIIRKKDWYKNENDRGSLKNAIKLLLPCLKEDVDKANELLSNGFYQEAIDSLLPYIEVVNSLYIDDKQERSRDSKKENSPNDSLFNIISTLDTLAAYAHYILINAYTIGDYPETTIKTHMEKFYKIFRKVFPKDNRPNFNISKLDELYNKIDEEEHKKKQLKKDASPNLFWVSSIGLIAGILLIEAAF